MVDLVHQRPRTQWWMDLRPIAQILSRPGPWIEEMEKEFQI